MSRMVRNPYANTPAGVLRKLNEKWRENPLDPNFGYETQGASYQTPWNRITGSVFTCPESGTAQSITVLHYQGAGAWTRWKCALYRHSDLALIGQTEERYEYLASGSYWQTFSFPAPKPNLSNIAYILACWAQWQGYDTYDYMTYDAGETDQGHYQALTYGDWPDPLVPTHENRKYSIYCTYTVPPPPAWGGSALPQLQMAKAILEL